MATGSGRMLALLVSRRSQGTIHILERHRAIPEASHRSTGVSGPSSWAFSLWSAVLP